MKKGSSVVVFCDSVCKTVPVNAAAWKHALQLCKGRHANDAVSYDAISRAHASASYLACGASDGKRFLLHLTRIDGIETCLFLDPKTAVVVHLLFDTFLFDNGGTIFVGELQKHDNVWVYLITDLLYTCGQVVQAPLTDRLSHVYGILQNSFQALGPQVDICVVQVMRHTRLSDVESELIPFLLSLPYNVDHVRLRPVARGNQDILLPLRGSNHEQTASGPVRGFDKYINRAKRTKSRPFHSQHVASSSNADTITRKLFVEKKNEPDIYELFESRNTTMSLGIAGIQTMDASRRMKQVFADIKAGERLLMVCAYNSSISKWVPNETV